MNNLETKISADIIINKWVQLFLFKGILVGLDAFGDLWVCYDVVSNDILSWRRCYHPAGFTDKEQKK